METTIPSLGVALARLAQISSILSTRQYWGEKEFARQALLWRIVGLVGTDAGNVPDISPDLQQTIYQVLHRQETEIAHVPKSIQEVQHH